MARRTKTPRPAPAVRASVAKPDPSYLPALTAAAAIAVACAPVLAHDSLHQGSDVWAWMHYLASFVQALGEGDLYPRWIAEGNHGFGSPAFILFPPLAYYGAALASALAGSLIAGMKIFFVAILALSGVAFYALARDWAGPGWPAALGTVAYVLLPYHILDVYQRFAVYESTAFIFFPLILLAARRLLAGGGRWAFLGLAFAYSGLVLTHLVTGFMFSLGLGPWLAWEGRGRWKSLLRPAVALACGLGIASIALLPAALESRHANVQWFREMPNGDFRINFIFKDEILPVLGIKDPIKPHVLKTAHAQLLLAGVALAAAAAGARAGSTGRRDAWKLGAVAGISYLMQLEISAPIWRVIPQLPTIQFPWRFQAFTVLAASLLVSLAVASLSHRGERTGRGLAVAALAVAGVINGLLSWQIAGLSPFTFDASKMERLAKTGGWSDPAATPVAFKDYYNFRWAKVDVPRVSVLDGAVEVGVERWASSHRTLAVASKGGGTVVLRAFWFPGWVGTIDGSPLMLSPAPPYGAISFRAPPGRSIVELRFEATPVRTAASWASALSLVVTFLAAWILPRPSAATTP